MHVLPWLTRHQRQIDFHVNRLRTRLQQWMVNLPAQLMAMMHQRNTDVDFEQVERIVEITSSSPTKH